jgi:type 1 glutamine amidotransferase
VLSLLLLIAHAQSTEPGISLRIYDIQASMSELMPLVPGQTPNIDRRIPAVDLKAGEFGIADRFVAELSGEFHAARDGEYTFRLTSDDGSELKIGNVQVVNNDGVHPAVSREGTLRLAAGWHSIGIRFFENDGGEELLLEVRAPGSSTFSIVDKTFLRCPANLTRVTSPGPKFLMGVGGPRRPGNGMPLDRGHPGYDIETIRPEGFKPQVGGMAFLPDGTLLVATFKPNQSGELLPDVADGKVWALQGVQGDARDVRARLVAENIQEPLGLAVMQVDGETRVYVSQRTEVSQLVDSDGDGRFEGTRTVAKAWLSDNYHHFTFGLAERDGFLYAALSTSITFGAPGINGPNPSNRGSLVRINPNTYDPQMPMKNVEFLTGGHRTPNGVSLGPHGMVLVGENQGAWQPANKVNLVFPGAFFGHYNNTDFKTPAYPQGGVPGAFDEQPLAHPVLYLPQNEAANSPGGIVTIPSGPYRDGILISDVKYGGLRRAWLEEVSGQWQGGVVQFSQGFESGTNRLVWGPDGSLFVGGTGATETWAWTDPKTGQWTTYGLQRMRPNGRDTFEIMWVRATPTGFRARFTRPVQDLSPDEVAVRQWDYVPTPDYGGEKQNRESLDVASIRLSPDRREVELDIPGLKEGRVVYLNLGVRSVSGNGLWATECWYTLNKIPRRSTTRTVPTAERFDTGSSRFGLLALIRERPRLLVFTRALGHRHDSIPAAVEAMRKLARDRGLSVVVTEDPSLFEPGQLFRTDVVVFLLTTGDVLDERQQEAFEAFIRRGGGFVGIHSATDTEYDWPFYTGLVGAQFAGAGISQDRVVVEDRFHPSTTFLPNNWTRVDEWYRFRSEPQGRILVRRSDGTPVTWCREFEGGRSWYTAMGHTSETYDELLFLEKLYQGILWAAQAGHPRQAEEVAWGRSRGWVRDADVWSNSGTGPEPLTSAEEYADALIHVEFQIPQGSNSGVYVQGRYEVQILDSFGKPAREMKVTDVGAIYERWENDRGFDGSAPMRNAFRGPGTWNTYDILFRAPRFDSAGRKVEDARFVEVRLNGVVVQREVAISGPTRAAPFGDERPSGPIVLQADHGPVRYRNAWVRRVRL